MYILANKGGFLIHNNNRQSSRFHWLRDGEKESLLTAEKTCKQFQGREHCVAGVKSGKFATGVKSGKFATGVKSGKFVTGVKSGKFVTGVKSGKFVTGVKSGKFVIGVKSGKFVTGVKSGKFVTGVKSGKFVTGVKSGKFVTGVKSGKFVTGVKTAGNFETGVKREKTCKPLLNKVRNCATTQREENMKLPPTAGNYVKRRKLQARVKDGKICNL